MDKVKADQIRQEIADSVPALTEFKVEEFRPWLGWYKGLKSTGVYELEVSPEDVSYDELLKLVEIVAKYNLSLALEADAFAPHWLRVYSPSERKRNGV